MRTVEINRKTAETNIRLSLSLDGSGTSQIETGIGFFNHMLTLLAKHALFDMQLTVQGDLQVDQHHTVEDTGLALGQALAKALGDKSSIRRYGQALIPMDEALVSCALDISGRSYLTIRTPEKLENTDNFNAELVEEFFRAFASAAGITLHLELFYGKNSHHIIEALFKACARALREAVSFDARVKGIPSSKGVL